MVRPRHGKLKLSAQNQWYFCPGNVQVIDKETILPNLVAHCHQLLDSGQLFKGHAKFKNVYES
jgi:hypothetical protein